MHATVLPLASALADALQRLEQAPNTARLQVVYARHGGILHGYYLAGGACAVECNAAQAELRRVYQARLGIFELQAQWRCGRTQPINDATPT